LPDQAIAVLEANSVDLVLINRKLDADGSDGLEILPRIRSGSKFSVPVMLVSNYADWQQKAVELGAVYGFGKAELNRPETRARLAAILEA
jgi:CheY-like chemotaxis protein